MGTVLGHVRHNLVAYVAMLLAVTLAPGSAYAALQIRSDDIVDGQVKSVDLADDAVRSRMVKNDTITGTDVLEASLGQVSSARQGGLGRYGYTGSCDPESETYIACSVTTVTLTAPARLLVIGTVRAKTEPNVEHAYGSCRIGTTSGPITTSAVEIYLHEFDDIYSHDEHVSVVAVTNPLPAGTHRVGIDCLQYQPQGAIYYQQARVVAVALSAD
jgi:hypothetical protein